MIQQPAWNYLNQWMSVQMRKGQKTKSCHPFCNDEFVFPIVFISHLTKSTVCISVFWPDFMTRSGLLPKRGAPALGNKRETPKTIARPCVYLPLHV